VEGYSPALLRKIVTQGGRYSSAEAARNLCDLAEVDISPQHVRDLATRVGREWTEGRDREAAAFEQNELARTYPEAPQAVAVMLDGGRAQTRAEPSGPGVQTPKWSEPKYACCLTLPHKEHKQDPQPQPPAKFLDRQVVPKLVQQLQRLHGAPTTRDPKPKVPPKKKPVRTRPTVRPTRRKRARTYLVRTVVATMSSVDYFTSLVAAEVFRRAFDLARQKACVCDGQASNWTVFERALRPLGFVPVLDFLHLLSYLYAAAQAVGGTVEKRWDRYCLWLTWAWQGHRERLLLALQGASARAGLPPPQAPASDPREILRTAAQYVRNNLDKMDYPRYRQLGLPISSAPVESLIKQFNRRVKGTEKFWTPSALEAILQIRAADLSEDGRLERFWSAPRPQGRPRHRAA